MTIRFPANSGRAATCIAAQTLAPVEIPAGRPSSCASFLAVSKASSLLTWMVSSMIATFRFPGMKPAPIRLREGSPSAAPCGALRRGSDVGKIHPQAGEELRMVGDGDVRQEHVECLGAVAMVLGPLDRVELGRPRPPVRR